MAACGAACVAGCFAGAWLYERQPDYHISNSVSSYLFIAFISILLFIVFKQIPFFMHYTGERDKILLFLLPFLFFCSGFRCYCQSMMSPLELLAQEEEEKTFTGKVYQAMQTENGSRIYVKDLVFCAGNEKQAVKGQLLLYNSSDAVPEIGNIIFVQGKLKTFRKATNYGQYDEYQYQKIRNLTAMVSTEKITVLDKSKDRLPCILQAWRQRLSEAYDSIFEAKEASVVKAMLLGEKTDLDKEMKELYSANGISHILAISGLHISMLGMLVYQFFKKWMLLFHRLGKAARFLSSRCGFWIFAGTHAPVQRMRSGNPVMGRPQKGFPIAVRMREKETTKGNVQKVFLRLFAAVPVIGSGLFVCLYGKMTGYGVSTSRAVVMFLLMISAEMFGRTYDIVTGMAAASLWILLRRPLYIADSGFWLSFLAVFAILGVLPVLEEMFPEKKARKAEVFSYLAGKIKDGMLASFAIFFTTFPVIIKTYFSYPLYGSLLNLLIIPLMSVLLPMAFLTGIAGVFCGPLAAVFAVPVSGILTFYETLCRLVKTIPGAVQLTGCPPDWKIAVYLLGMGSVLLLWKKWRFQRCLVLVGACLFLGFMYRLPSSDFKVHFLDIGQGDCIVMELPGGAVVTADGGSSDVSKAGEYRLLPFLKASGHKVIECAFLTHMDADHINAVQELLEMEEGEKGDIFIRNLVVPAVLKENETWKKLAKTAGEKGTGIFYIKAGDKMELGQVSFACLHPSENFSDSSENAASLVLKVTYGRCDILLTGDVEGNGEKFLIENCADELKGTDVLKVAHHGSKNSTSEAFLEICSPFVSILSCSAKNRYGHPHPELLERLLENGSQILQTKDSGEITLITDGEKMKWELFRTQ